MALSEAQLASFAGRGWVHGPAAFARETALEMQARMWEELRDVQGARISRIGRAGGGDRPQRERDR